METTQYDIAFFVSVGHGRSLLKINSCSKRRCPEILFKNTVYRNSCSEMRCPEIRFQKYGVPELLLKNTVSRKSCSKIMCPESPVQNSLVLLGAVGLAGLAKLTALPHLRDPEVFRPCHLPGLGQAYPTES
jgi:hypothetical protein